jgi:hypothetical protein
MKRPIVRNLPHPWYQDTSTHYDNPIMLCKPMSNDFVFVYQMGEIKCSTRETSLEIPKQLIVEAWKAWDEISC